MTTLTAETINRIASGASRTTSPVGLLAHPERVRSALRFIDPHNRDAWVKMAFAIKSEFGESGFDIWDEWGAAHPRPASEVKSTWKSAKPGGKVGLGSLFYDAKAAGWKDDSKYKKPSAQVIEQRKAAAVARAAQYEAEEAAEQAAAAERAQKLWDAAAPVGSHPYLERKGVASHGLKVGPFEIERTDPNTGEVTKSRPKALLVPLYDHDGKLWSLQAISAKSGGPKLLFQSGKMSGNFFPIGVKPLEHEGRKVFVLAEGYATSASLHESTGHLVLVCFNASNLLAVGKQVRERDPNAIILFAADNDLWNRKPDGTPHNPGVEAASKAAAAIGGIVCPPPFTLEDAFGKDEKGNPTGPKDWNDWHGINGAVSVAEIIGMALARPVTIVLAPERQSATGAAIAMSALLQGDELSSDVATFTGKGPSDLVVQVYGDDLSQRAAELSARYPGGHVYILARPGEEQTALDIAEAHGVRAETLAEFGGGRFDNWFDAMMAELDAVADASPSARQAAEQVLERAVIAQGEPAAGEDGGEAQSATVASMQASIIDVHYMDEVNPFDWPHLSESKKPLNTIPNLRRLLKNYKITARYDVIRKEVMVTHPGQRGTRDNAKSKAIDTVVSLCALNKLPRTDVPSFLASIADDTPYNPVMDFITSKPWDGRSRFEDLLQTVQTKPGFDRGLLVLLARRWFISAVAAAAKPSGFWSKGVLVFQGDQSLGKTSWFRALLPSDVRDLVKVDASIDPANKDSIISAVSHWLVELGELDGTLRKADIARLKGFISQDVDQFRRPYARAEEKFQRRTVFFASVNPEQFLADDTGNVRWWTIPVVGINHGHDIDMQQLWAEVYTWFEAGERWWLDRDEENRLNASNAEHEQRDPIDELIASKYDFSDPTRRSVNATQVLLELGYDSPSKKLLNEAANIMRKHFGEPRRTGKGRFFQVPVLHRFGH